MRKEEIDTVVALQNDQGELLATDVVNAARDPESPIHGRFTWDDSKAAQERRLDQARALIRAVTFKVTIGALKVAVPMYVRDPSKEGLSEGYVATATLQTDQDRAREAIVAEFKAVAARLQRARRLAIALEMPPNQIDEIADAVGAVAEHFAPAPATPQ